MGTLVHAKEHAEFVTVTCLDWQPLLKEDSTKNIIIESLRFLCHEERISVYAFVIMSNHLHLIWQMLGNHQRKDVQRDFLKYTGQQILKKLRKESSSLLKTLEVNLPDRKFQVWQRNSLGISLWSDKALYQKLAYIHYNPVRAGLCKTPEDYLYSSASFYMKSDGRWEFLNHVDG